MLMLSRRLQVLIDEERYRRLEQEARSRGVSVGLLVREALDASYPVTSQDRVRASERILSADPMPVPSPAQLKAEIAEGHGW